MDDGSVVRREAAARAWPMRLCRICVGGGSDAGCRRPGCPPVGGAPDGRRVAAHRCSNSLHAGLCTTAATIRAMRSTCEFGRRKLSVPAGMQQALPAGVEAGCRACSADLVVASSARWVQGGLRDRKSVV